MRISNPPPFAYGPGNVDGQAIQRAPKAEAPAARSVSVAELVAEENRMAALQGSFDISDAGLGDFARRADAGTRRADLQL